MAANLSEDMAVRFAMLCHDLGKALTPRAFWPSHHGHGPAGVKLVEVLCQRLNVPNDLRDLAKIFAKYHNLLHGAANLTPQTLIKLFRAIDVWRRPERLEQLIIASEANFRGRIGFENHLYPQGSFLREAFCFANSVTARDVIMTGFRGAQIGEELERRRQQILAIWKQQRTTINTKTMLY